MFIVVLLSLALLLGLACFALFGSVGVAAGGFLRLGLGALLTSFMLSIVLSGIANYLLASLAVVQGSAPRGAYAVFLKCVLAALAQPTLTGVSVLAIMILLAMSVARVCSLVEDIAVLTESHKSFMERGKQMDGKDMEVNPQAK